MPPSRLTEATARRLRSELTDGVRAALPQAVADAPPDRDRRIDRLRLSVPAGSDAEAVGEAIRRAIEIELRRRR